MNLNGDISKVGGLREKIIAASLNKINKIYVPYDNKEEVSNLYKRFLDNQIKIFMDLKNTEYGTLEFGLLDLDENMIIVSC